MFQNLFTNTDQLYSIGLAALLGAFLGLRREIAASVSEKNRSFMGLRTMTMLSVAGAVSTLFSNLPILPLIFFGGIIVLVGLAYAHGSFSLERMGMTTELTALMTYWIGVMVASDMMTEAFALTLLLAFTNAFKQEFRNFVKTLSIKEWRGILQLLIVTGVILPLLPNTTIDPWGIFNPFETWLIVIMISGIGFVGYFLIKYFGAKAGIPLMSFLGGMASSTAVSTAMADQSKKLKLKGLFAAGILVALATMQIKVFLYIISLGHELDMEPKLLLAPWILSGCCLGFAVYNFLKSHNRGKSWFRRDDDPNEALEIDSPFEIMPALKFGLVYVAILTVLYFAQQWLGNSGAYVAAIFSGLIDIDSIVLASIKQAKDGTMPIQVAQNAIAIGLFCNTYIKVLFIQILGSRYLFKEVFVAITASVGIAGTVYLFM